jgi:hypothetical protein
MPDRDEIVHNLDRALISVVALRIASEGKEIAIVLREIQDAMDGAHEELTRK